MRHISTGGKMPAWKKFLPWFILSLFSVPLFFIGVVDVHGWGDDFAQYIKEAQNIANGRPFYESAYIYNPNNPVYAPHHYPPGFPLLMAPIVKQFGISIRPLLYLTS